MGYSILSDDLVTLFPRSNRYEGIMIITFVQHLSQYTDSNLSKPARLPL